MRILKIIFWILWRVWFYILVALPIIVLFPLLLLSISRELWYKYFFKIARLWARFILFFMGFKVDVTTIEKPEPNKSYMFIANHTSMTDIMLMLAIIKNPFVFVGKKELASIPLFGFFYRRTSILVDRDSKKSRYEVYEQAQRRLNQGLSICIFPEGKVPEEHIVLDEFKDGAFRLAIEHQIPIVPITFLDNKRLFSYTFFSGSPGKMRAVIHSFIYTALLEQDSKKSIKEQSRNIILDCLQNNN